MEHLEWLQQPCPHWCHCDHSGQEHPTDRKRLADQPFATLITQEPEHREQREFKDSIKAEDMAIAVYRKRGDYEVWLRIVNDREHVEINLESSARLSASLNAFIVEVIVSSD